MPCVEQAGLELTEMPPECWNQSHAPPHTSLLSVLLMPALWQTGREMSRSLFSPEMEPHRPTPPPIYFLIPSGRIPMTGRQLAI